MDIFWQSCGCFQDCRQYNHIFTIRKLDSVTGAPIAGAEFTLTPLCGIGTRVGTTDANGRLTFCVTPCTGYELRESATPSGYTPNTDLHTVCVGANGCVTVDGVAVCIYDIFNIPLSAFSVTYLPNGGTGTFTDSDLVAGSLYTIKSAAETGITRPGYTFVSWNTAPDGTGTTYVPGDVIHITGDLTLYAQWVAEMTFSVVYGPNGGTGGHTDSGLAAGASYTIRSAAEANVSRAGYSFASWNTASDGTGTTYLPGEMITITGDLVLYAQWTPDLFSLIYDPNGGTGG
ncbi:MAG: InlB B-repeat-containing protein, partial [Oscillospiraceae bacterium]|nr:InlB B-repeat-containing protein [Oscillospiraceae bacterium]